MNTALSSKPYCHNPATYLSSESCALYSAVNKILVIKKHVAIAGTVDKVEAMIRLKLK